MDYSIPPGMEAVEKLEDFIEVNRLTANTRIPSERDLCEMWGVSRSTLRQAVDILVGQGVLYRVKGLGVYVAVGKKSRNMSGVDSMMSELRQQGVSLTKRIIQRRTIEATKQISRKLRVPLGHKVYEYVKLRKVDYVPSIIETTYIDCETFPDFDKYYDNKTEMGYLIKHIYHINQSSGEEKISVTYASEDEARLLEIETGAPMFFASGLIESDDGVPVMYYKQLIRSDVFKFVSVIE